MYTDVPKILFKISLNIMQIFWEKLEKVKEVSYASSLGDLSYNYVIYSDPELNFILLFLLLSNFPLSSS